MFMRKFKMTFKIKRPKAYMTKEQGFQGKKFFQVHSEGLTDNDYVYDYEESAIQQVKNLNRKNSKDIKRKWRNLK